MSTQESANSGVNEGGPSRVSMGPLPPRPESSEGNEPLSPADSFTSQHMDAEREPEDAPVHQAHDDVEGVGAETSLNDRDQDTEVFKDEDSSSADDASDHPQVYGGTFNGTSAVTSKRTRSPWASTPNVDTDDSIDCLLTKWERQASIQRSPKSKPEILKLCTDAPEEKFGISTTLLSTQPSEEGDTLDSEKLEDNLVNNMKILESVHNHFIQYDMTFVTNVPNLKNEYASLPTLMWGVVYTCMFLMWESLKYDQVLLWQETVNNWVKKDHPDYLTNRWALLYLRNCCTTSLLERIDRKYKTLEKLQKGPASFLFILLKTVFFTSRDTIASMNKFLTVIERKGLKLFEGESVLRFVAYVEVIIKRLHACKSLPSDAPTMILKGLSKCTNASFRGIILQLLNAEQMENLGVSYDSQYTFGDKDTYTSCKEILEKFSELFVNKINNKDWLPLDVAGRNNKSSFNAASIVQDLRKCFNCDDTDHLANECPKPRNKALFDKNMKEFREKKKKQAKGESDKSDKTWDNKRSNAVVVKKGKALMFCKGCNKKVATHSTKYHNDWTAAKDSFCLADVSPEHPLVKAQQVLDATKNHGASPSGSSTSALVASGPPPGMVLINKQQATAELSRLERSTSNPDTAAVVGALRAALSLN